MKKLLKFLLLAFLLLAFRYLFSIVIFYLLPSYQGSTKETHLLTDSNFFYKIEPSISAARMWDTWDSIHYTNIATTGYDNEKFSTSTYKNLALYPLYPLTVKALTKVIPFPESRDKVIITGAVVSTIFFGFALFFFG